MERWAQADQGRRASGTFRDTLFSSAQRIIFLVDIDSFYPSVEVRENPSLRGLPIVVGADPKGGRGRGVVASCSYEARKLGIRAGMPISRAYGICPSAVYLRPNFHLYGNVSEKVMDIIGNFSDVFEQVSIDEAFLDVTKSSGENWDAARRIALLLKKDVLEKEGLTCSVGIAPNKSTAKIAAEYQKPNGLTTVEPSKVLEFLRPLPVSAITGVGPKTREFLESIGVKSIGDLQALQGEELVKHFGKTGVWLWGVAHGLEEIPVRERTLMKSLSAEHTFDSDVLDRNQVLEKLFELVATLHHRLQSAGYEYRVVGIRIRFAHFQTYTRENTLPNYTQDKGTILSEARTLFKEFEGNNKRVRLIGVRVSDLRRKDGQSNVEGGLETWLEERHES